MVCYLYLPLHSERYALVLGLIVGGVAVGFGMHAAIRRLPDRNWIRAIILGIVATILFSPMVSLAMHRVTYARFGLTVFGVLPIPFLDVTVSESGVLWFREKTHQITATEIDRLISKDVEIVIIGNGWHSIAQLDDGVIESHPGIEFHVLPTPDAIALYNSLVAQGRVVVLLAHSTC